MAMLRSIYYIIGEGQEVRITISDKSSSAQPMSSKHSRNRVFMIAFAMEDGGTL